MLDSRSHESFSDLLLPVAALQPWKRNESKVFLLALQYYHGLSFAKLFFSALALLSFILNKNRLKLQQKFFRVKRRGSSEARTEFA